MITLGQDNVKLFRSVFIPGPLSALGNIYVKLAWAQLLWALSHFDLSWRAGGGFGVETDRNHVPLYWPW